MWKDRLRNVYDSFEEFEGYDRAYNLVERLGYRTVEEAWDDNPLIQGSTDPADFGVVKKNLRRRPHLSHSRRFSHLKNPSKHWKIDNDTVYKIIFDYYGLEEELDGLIAQLTYYYYSHYDEINRCLWGEIHIDGRGLKRFIAELIDNPKVGGKIMIINQETDEEYEGWDEIGRLIR